MSRVRVYELAKEAGMTGKDLADKLIAEGYDVKGHSSTVDEDTAEKIRRTMLQNSETELVEKRIDASQGATVIRRRATIIRRRPKADQEEPAEETIETEEAEQDTAVADTDEPVAQPEAEEASVRPPRDEEELQPSAKETAEQTEEMARPIADAKQDAAPSTETDAGASDEAVEAPAAQPAGQDDRRSPPSSRMPSCAVSVR